MSNIDKVSHWIEIFGKKVRENKDILNTLDTAIGDGDHGSNMARGVTAMQEKMNEKKSDNLADLLKEIAMTIISKVGGASGPLYGSAFMGMAKQAKESDNMGEILAAGLEGILKRGKAGVGEKTMIDIWSPVVETIQNGTLTQEYIERSLEKTREMKATKGRASYLGERSIGHIDPGAQSSAYLFMALLESGVLDD